MKPTLMKNEAKTQQSLLEHYACAPVKLSGDSDAFNPAKT